jgi:hypothetical protein
MLRSMAPCLWRQRIRKGYTERCDLERERRAAVEAGDELGVDVVASSVRGIAAYLEGAASER